MKKALILAVAMVLVAASVSFAVIAGSKHDLTNPTYFSNATLSACQYCHTPHLRNNTAVTGAPLWNRTLPSGPYTVYGGGSTLGGTTVNQPGVNSRTCLSCHDGTIALGSVLVGNGGTIDEATGRPNFIVNGALVEVATETGTYPYLGTDLSNEHPVGFNFVAGRAGVPSMPSWAKLYNYGGTDTQRFECASCHDPHETTNQPFLRASKGTICTDCHSQK